MHKIILASTSPFRKAIMQKLDIKFDSIAPDIDETPLPGETPQQLVERLSVKKAQAVATKNPGALVIGSDQVAVINEKILGKPGDHETAVSQLKASSGRTVQFYTGLCLYNSESEHFQVEVVPYAVLFRQLTEQQITNYLHKEQPYNCAGSFKSEGLGVCLFEKLQGDDPNTLVGLPLIRLVRMLEKEGVAII